MVTRFRVNNVDMTSDKNCVELIEVGYDRGRRVRWIKDGCQKVTFVNFDASLMVFTKPQPTYPGGDFLETGDLSAGMCALMTD